MLWMYKAAQCTFPWRGWILKSESIPVCSIGNAKWQDVHPFSHDCYYLSEVSGELKPDSGWHGSVKPIKVVQDILSRITELGAVVFEPFLGSGTTMVASENLGRKCFGIEISQNYAAVILQRMKDAFPLLEIKKLA
jgi:DNA modification methylase